MERPEIQVRQAGVEDAPAITRLLDDFNREFEEPTPGVEALTATVRRLLEEDELSGLLFYEREI